MLYPAVSLRDLSVDDMYMCVQQCLYEMCLILMWLQMWLQSLVGWCQQLCTLGATLISSLCTIRLAGTPPRAVSVIASSQALLLQHPNVAAHPLHPTYSAVYVLRAAYAVPGLSAVHVCSGRLHGRYRLVVAAF